MPSGDSTATADGLRSDKPDDKLGDKPETPDQALELVTKAWPTLPETIRHAILAMVQAFVRRDPEIHSD